MAKGYWIAHVDVTDPQAYERYRDANAAPLAAFGGRFLARGGASQAPEGTSRSRHAIIEFATYQAALDCYASPDYQEVKALRAQASDGNLIIVEGYDGPQPGDGSGTDPKRG